jgi:hypothetical protein
MSSEENRRKPDVHRRRILQSSTSGTSNSLLGSMEAAIVAVFEPNDTFFGLPPRR